MSTKVLLDTDIGSNIDDALCLAYLLAQPECDLLGVTTVGGEAHKRASLASALCKAAGKDVPVYPGADGPLVVDQRPRPVTQAAALHRWEHDSAFPEGEAVEFMRRTVRESPGEVVLVAIGALTNVGLLLAVDSQVASLLKGLVMMCGAFADGPPGAPVLEGNAVRDPHAAAMAYRAPVRLHRSVGLDVTRQVVMPVSEVRRNLASDLGAVVLDLAQAWGRESVTFHDPLAAAPVFDSNICGFERGTVDVELADERLKGQTRWTPDDTGPTRSP